MNKSPVRALVTQLDKQSKKLMIAETMVYAMLTASTILFLFLVGAFVSAASLKGIALPPMLAISTVLIVLSTLLVVKLKRFKKNDQLSSFRKTVVAIAVLGILFFVCQFFGLQQLQRLLPGNNRNLMLILIATHAIHFMVALGTTSYLIAKCFKLKTGSDLYIHFLNVKQNTFFKLSFIYWDFLSCVWIVIFLVMQVKSLT
jgi:heme/copper-type cytochrome/quinol oxidase subunit 3